MTKTFGAVLLQSSSANYIRKSKLSAPLIVNNNHHDITNYLENETKALVLPKNVTARNTVKLVMEREGLVEEPFYVVDLSSIVRQVERWKKNLPRVDIFYAVKCNPSDYVLKTLAALGCSFDCASKEEIEAVMALGTVDAATRIIFANPCKQVSHIRHASKVGVEFVTVDNTYELEKLKRDWPEAKVLIRIKTDDSHSLCQFSSKFGASLLDCEAIIEKAKELSINLVGVSFHVGSGCKDALSYEKAIKNARYVFDAAYKQAGYEMNMLDIGGGFPGINVDGEVSFEQIAAVIRKNTDELFPASVRVIAEPGRYIVTESHTLVCNVHAKRDCRSAKTANHTGADFLYYMNDGVYGAFNCLFFDHYCVKEILRVKAEDNPSDPKYKATLFGPTCDSIDKIVENLEMPELDVGEYVFFPDFGAYTLAAASKFNGFSTTKRFFIVKV